MANIMKFHLKFYLYAIVIALAIPINGFCDELSEREAVKTDVIASITNEDFPKLENLSNTYLNSKTRTSSGLWKLTLFYAAIASYLDTQHKDDEFWLPKERLTRSWVEHYPKSATAHLAYARMLLNRGWSYRGGGYANTVEKQNWKPFQEYTEKARIYLEKYKAVCSKDPYWYELMAIIAYRQDWSQNEFSKLIKEGIENHPSYYQIYFAAIDYYSPKWGGDASLIEAFATDSLKKTQSSEGFEMYARIYWYASQTQYGTRLFTDSLVDWPKMKRGIDDTLSKYPDNWNINNFAKFSCMSGDKVKTAELIKRLDTPPIQYVWGSMNYFLSCKTWANEK